MHEIWEIIDFRRGASNGSQSRIVVMTRGEHKSQWTGSSCTAMICRLIGSVLISRPNNWSQIHLLIFVRCDAQAHKRAHTHTHRVPAITLGKTVSESLVWSSIMHDFGRMKGCFGLRHVSHMERHQQSQFLTVHSCWKWVCLRMSTPNWSSGIKCELIWRKGFEK